MVAVPETAGVHWKTCSGALPEKPQLPACRPVPLVAPVNVPPCAGTTTGVPQLPPASVVVVVPVVVAVVVVLVVVAVVLVLGVLVAARKVASTVNQLVAVPRVRLPCCGPAALERMSSRSEAALPFCASRTYGTIWLLPGA